MDVIAPSSSKMDEEEMKNEKHLRTYVIFRMEDKSLAPVPVTWIVNDLIEEYNECCWPGHLSRAQILTAMKEYSTERKETWPRFKGMVLNVYLNYMAASKACDLYKDKETNLKDELKIELYFKSQSNVFRHAEKSERIKLNKISKRSQEEKCLVQETSTVIDKKFQEPCRKITKEDVAQIGLQADLQAYIKKVEQTEAKIELYKEKIDEQKTLNITAEQDEPTKEIKMREIKDYKQPAKNTKSPNNFISSNLNKKIKVTDKISGLSNDPEGQVSQTLKNIDYINELTANHYRGNQDLQQETTVDVELNTDQNTQHYTTELTYHKSTYFEEKNLSNNSIIAQQNKDNVAEEETPLQCRPDLQNQYTNISGHDAFISQLKGLKENINQCENHFNSFIKECEPSRIQNSTSATSSNIEIKSKSLEKNVNVGRCLEHSDSVLNLRCLTHKAWICHNCCVDDHPKNYCKIITFEEELEARKYKEEQRLQGESKKVSDTIACLFELGNETEKARNGNIQKLNEMQAAIQKLIFDINQLGNEMSFLKEFMSEGKEFQQKIKEKMDNVSFTTNISDLALFTKSYLEILTQSKNWCEKHQKNN